MTFPICTYECNKKYYSCTLNQDNLEAKVLIKKLVNATNKFKYFQFFFTQQVLTSGYRQFCQPKIGYTIFCTTQIFRRRLFVSMALDFSAQIEYAQFIILLSFCSGILNIVHLALLAILLLTYFSHMLPTILCFILQKKTLQLRILLSFSSG